MQSQLTVRFGLTFTEIQSVDDLFGIPDYLALDGCEFHRLIPDLMARKKYVAVLKLERFLYEQRNSVLVPYPIIGKPTLRRFLVPKL